MAQLVYFIKGSYILIHIFHRMGVIYLDETTIFRIYHYI